jgi:hypothetical protein
MKTLLIGSVVAVALLLGVGAGQASAGWEYRTGYRFDPHCGRFIAYQQRIWVPDHHHRHHDHGFDRGHGHRHDHGHGHNHGHRHGQFERPSFFPFPR